MQQSVLPVGLLRRSVMLYARQMHTSSHLSAVLRTQGGGAAVCLIMANG
jgi:hypothetical protein